MKTANPNAVDYAELRRMLIALDVEPCTCPADWREDAGAGERFHLCECKHVRAARMHSLTLDQWRTLLEAADADDYAERPFGPPSSALTQEARVACMLLRQAAGLALRDQKQDDEDDLAQMAGRNKIARRLVADTEHERGFNNHGLTPGELASVQALATREGEPRLVCQIKNHMHWSVRFRDARPRDWKYARLQINPQVYGREEDTHERMPDDDDAPSAQD